MKIRAIATALLIALIGIAPQATASTDDIQQVFAKRWTAQGWKTDFTKASVKFQEIMSGGPPRDGIPPIDKPKFKRVSAIDNLDDVEAVVSLKIGNSARAYPLQILMWHEIVNDTIEGNPVAVTYCPLCNAAIAFDRRLDSTVLDFGTTGKLRKSDLVMWDRQTESWWQQFTGEAIVGSMTGKSLKVLPARLESWAAFKQRHPNGEVLVPNNPGLRDYGRNPYTQYDNLKSSPFLYQGEMPKGIEPMARVVVVDTGNGKEAVALRLLRQKRSMNLDGITLSWSEGQASALERARVAEGRDVGNVVVQKDGKDMPYDVTFAFVFHAFHPKGRLLLN